MVIGQIMPTNPAAAARGPRHIVRRSKTSVLDPREARQLLNAIDTTTVIGAAFSGDFHNHGLRPVRGWHQPMSHLVPVQTRQTAGLRAGWPRNACRGSHRRVEVSRGQSSFQKERMARGPPATRETERGMSEDALSSAETMR